MTALFKNNAFSTLASGINDSVTSISLDSGDGAKFPSPSSPTYFYATLIDTSNNLEIVKCTARSTDVLTVTRAQESTTARAYSAVGPIKLMGLLQVPNILLKLMLLGVQESLILLVKVQLKSGLRKQKTIL